MEYPVTPFGPDIWLAKGPTVTGAMGFRFPTRMAVIRLPDDGGLWIWSPVEMTKDLRTAIDELGVVRHLVAPNSLHHMFLANWAKTYPDAKVHAAPGLSAKTTGTSIHCTLDDDPNPAWQETLGQVVIRGNKITSEVVFFHRPSATVLVTDFIQQLPQGWYTGWRALIARADLMTAPVPSVPRKFRLATTDKTAARHAVRKILEWPADRLVFAHGSPIEVNARATLENTFRWLQPSRH